MAVKKNSSSYDRLLKTATPIYLEPETFRKLKQLSKKTRTPSQVFMREGIDMVLAKYKRSLSK